MLNGFFSEGRILKLIDILVTRGLLSSGVYMHKINEPTGKIHDFPQDVLYLVNTEEC